MINSGIYKISSLIDDRCYIGSAENFSKRWKMHKSQLKNGKHHSRHLQRFYNKYGLDKLSFEVIEYCSVDILKKEQYYIDTLAPSFNCSLIAGNAFKGNKYWVGRKHTEDSKAKMSKSKKGIKSRLGKKHTAESIILMSKNRRGTKVSAEVIERRNKTRQLNKVKHFT